MNNKDVEKELDDTLIELESIKVLMGTGSLSNVSSYLIKYAIIRACGAIEVAYKSIVADFCDSKTSIQQLNYYIDNNVRGNSMNPSISNLHGLLKRFDRSWNNNFKTKLNQENDREIWESSLESLNNERNKIAHGKSSTSLSINDVILYFNNSVKIVEIFDEVVQ